MVKDPSFLYQNAILHVINYRLLDGMAIISDFTTTDCQTAGLVQEEQLITTLQEAQDQIVEYQG